MLKAALNAIIQEEKKARQYGKPFSFVYKDAVGYVDADDFVQFQGKEFLVSEADKPMRYAIEKERQRALGIDNLRFYDNPRYFDRFTVIFMDVPEKNDHFYALAMSEKPFAPSGFGQHTVAQPGFHLGRRIWFTDLSADCQRLVMGEACQNAAG